MNFPENLKYTKEHEWFRAEGSDAVVGITDYAQGELGDVVYVDLPAVGRIVKQGESCGTIEAVKAVSDIYSPVSGEIVELNPALADKSELVNSDPYEAGWMFRIKPTNASEVACLLDAAAYKALIGK